jgi:hypothetical protein
MRASLTLTNIVRNDSTVAFEWLHEGTNGG